MGKVRAATDVDVSIIICTRDRSEDLRLMLEHMGRAHVPREWRAELLVVDNGSSDDTRAIVEAASTPNLDRRYVFAPEKGKGYAYNAGLNAARGKVMLFTDDDVHVPADWIERMCGPILDGSADAVQGAVHIAPHLERPWLKDVLRTWVAAVEDPEEAPEGGLVGANMAIGRAAMASVGPFDLRLGPGAAGYFDDTLVGWALLRAGGRILYRPDAAVEHNFAADRLGLGPMMAVARRMAMSRAIVDRSLDPALGRPSIGALAIQAPGLAWRTLTQLARYIIRREPDRGFLVRYYRLKLWQALRASA